MSAIGAVGREAFAGKGELEEIRVVIRADPAEEIELEVAFDGIGEKCGEFEGAEFEIDAYAAPLFLKSSAENAELFVGGGL